MIKRIPDCPGGMGNANDWIKAREALGYPQNRTVSYEYTTYENSGSDTLALLQQAHKEELEYGDSMCKIGFEWGYEQALEDLKKILKTDRSADSIKRVLRKTKCPISIQNRFYKIKSIIRADDRKKEKS